MLMGIGKTKWAIAQFERPYKVEDLDELKEMPLEPGHRRHRLRRMPLRRLLQEDHDLAHRLQPAAHRARTNARIPAEVKTMSS